MHLTPFFYFKISFKLCVVINLNQRAIMNSTTVKTIAIGVGTLAVWEFVVKPFINSIKGS